MEFPELAAAVVPQVRKTRNLPADAVGGYHIRKLHIAPLATPCGKSHTPRGKPGKAPSQSARPTPLVTWGGVGSRRWSGENIRNAISNDLACLVIHDKALCRDGAFVKPCA